MKASPKDMQAGLHATLTSLVGSGYTMKPAHLDRLEFRKDGQPVWFLPRFQMNNLTWGTIIGYLLWARSNGWDEVELHTPDIPAWLSLGQQVYSKTDEAEVRKLVKFILKFPYWAQTQASRDAHTELWLRFNKPCPDQHDHYMQIVADESRGLPKYFTGKPYPVYNYATSAPLTNEEYAKIRGITVEQAIAEREIQLELQHKLGIPTTKGKGK